MCGKLFVLQGGRDEDLPDFAEVSQLTLWDGSRCYCLEDTLTFDLKEIRAVKFQIIVS